MASPLSQHGAQNRPSRYAPIFTNRFFTGLWTQRNPLRDAATSYLLEKFYSGARYESLIDGSNCELTNRLTIARRPGTSTYNNQNFTNIQSFYEFKTFTAGTETIKVIVSTTATVRDATGPSTNALIYTKGTTNQTFFQSVLNQLYFGDGNAVKRWDMTTVYNWGVVAPVTIAQGTSALPNKWSPGSWVANSVWSFNSASALFFAIIDDTGNLQYFTLPAHTVDFVTGPTYPVFNKTVGGSTSEKGIAGSVTWICGGVPQGWVGTTAYAKSQSIIDPNGNIQIATTGGTTAGAAPAFSAVAGGTVADGTVVWTCWGPGKEVAANGRYYGYAYHTNSGQVSTLSPVVFAEGGILNNFLFNGIGSADPQVDAIWIFSSVDGGPSSDLFFLDTIANPGATAFNYTDSRASDATLNIQLPAQIAHTNDPPPTGLVHLALHVGRIWGSVANVLYYSAGPDTVTGNGMESFPPNNYAVLPSAIVRLVPTAVGLLVFTTSDLYIVTGSTSVSSGLSPTNFVVLPFLKGLGLVNYNALDMHAGTIFFYTSENTVVSLDPSPGVSEIGFPIGDILQKFTPANVYVAWQSGGSDDKALYVADGSTGWYRLNPVPSPETGMTWSPKANIVGGVKAIQSVEVSPGVHFLLMGPTGTGTIKKRDTSVFTDNGTQFSWFFTIGSLIFAQPGEVAELVFLESDMPILDVNGATCGQPTIGVLLGEIAGSFANLTNTPVSDPPILPPPASLYSNRYYFSQTAKPAWVRHLQTKYSFGNSAAQEEIYTYTWYGAVWQEKHGAA